MQKCEMCKNGQSMLVFGIDLCNLISKYDIHNQQESFVIENVTPRIVDIVYKVDDKELAYVAIANDAQFDSFIVHRSNDDSSEYKEKMARTHYLRIFNTEIKKKFQQFINVHYSFNKGV